MRYLFRGGYLLAFLFLVYFAGASIYWSSVEWNYVSSPLLIWTAIPLIVFTLGAILLVWCPAEGEPTEWLMPLLFPFVAFMICRLMFNFYVIEPMKVSPETNDEMHPLPWEEVIEPGEPPHVLVPQFSLNEGQEGGSFKLKILPPEVERPEITPPEPPSYPMTFYFSSISLILMAVYSLIDRMGSGGKVGQGYRLSYCVVAVVAIGVAIHNVVRPYGPLQQIVERSDW